jgi:ABC-2 type transport system permease protein
LADVAALPGLLEQIRLVAGLRWRILRNNMKNKNRRLDVIGVVISSVLGGLFVIGLSVAFFAITIAFLKGHRESLMALLFWLIFLWWQVMPIFVAGFSPSFPFRNLLRFPLKFPAFYLISIAYGLADSAALASLCWLLAMLLAVAVEKPEVLPVMLVTCILFVAMNVAMERLVGAWLEKILSKRRSRELFFGLFLLLIVGIQFIGPAIEKYQKVAKPLFLQILPYLNALPGSLAGHAVGDAALQNWGVTLLSLAGLFGYSVLFGALLWWRLAAQYRGEELSETVAPQRPLKKSRLLAMPMAPEMSGLRLLPPTVSVILAKEVHYVLRNGFALVSLIFPPLLVLFFGLEFAGAHPVAKHGISPDLFFPGMMAYLVLILMTASYNCFAFEGRGMQTYFMVPVAFRDVLLGKNLMQVSLLGLEMVLCIVVLAWKVGLPSLPVFVATLAAIVFAVVGQLSIANWSSLSFPKKMEFGKMKGQRQGGMAVLIAFGAQIIFGLICGVILAAGRWTGDAWLPAEAFLFLAAAAVAGYFASLEPLTRLAESKKEALLETFVR